MEEVVDLEEYVALQRERVRKALREGVQAGVISRRLLSFDPENPTLWVLDSIINEICVQRQEEPTQDTVALAVRNIAARSLKRRR